MAWLVIIGSLPIAIVGFALRHFISDQLRSLWIVAFAMIIWGGVMLLAEAVAKQDRGEMDLNLPDALLIGFGQCLALIPGVSRSGATISIGLMRGLTGSSATRLSFLLGIPALIGAGGFELPDALARRDGRGSDGRLAADAGGHRGVVHRRLRLGGLAVEVRLRPQDHLVRLVPLDGGRCADHRAVHRRPGGDMTVDR